MKRMLISMHANTRTRTRTRTQWSWCDSREVKNRNINFYTSVPQKVLSIFVANFHIYALISMFNMFLFDFSFSISFFSLELSLTLFLSLSFSLFCHSATRSVFFTKWTHWITIVWQAIWRREKERMNKWAQTDWEWFITKRIWCQKINK